MADQSYRGHSRRNYGRGDDLGATIEQINSGSLQRVADAVEKMAEPWLEMRRRAEYYEKRAIEMRSEIDQLIRQRNALRGVITRMKKAKGGGR